MDANERELKKVQWNGVRALERGQGVVLSYSVLTSFTPCEFGLTGRTP